MFPGLFVSPLPPKDTFLVFQKEDSDSMKQRKQGIKNFIVEIVAHELLGSH